MQRIGSLRLVALSITVVGVACQPAPVQTAPRPATSAPQLVPAPASMALTGATPFDLARTSTIVTDGTNPEVSAIAEKLAAQLRRRTEFPLAISNGAPTHGAIVLRLDGGTGTSAASSSPTVS